MIKRVPILDRRTQGLEGTTITSFDSFHIIVPIVNIRPLDIRNDTKTKRCRCCCRWRGLGCWIHVVLELVLLLLSAGAPCTGTGTGTGTLECCHHRAPSWSGVSGGCRRSYSSCVRIYGSGGIHQEHCCCYCGDDVGSTGNNGRRGGYHHQTDRTT